MDMVGPGFLDPRADPSQRREREAVVLYDVVRLMAEADVEASLRAVAERLREELDLAAVIVEIESAVAATRVFFFASNSSVSLAMRAGLAVRRLSTAAFTSTAAEAALKVGIKQVVFDRNGGAYHGKIKALADSARKAGLAF